MAYTHTFRYAIFPHRPEKFETMGSLNEQCEKFHYPLLAVGRKNTEELKLEDSLLALSPKATVLSAIKESEDAKAAIVRWWDPTPHEISIDLSLHWPVKSAMLAKLNETDINALIVAPNLSRLARNGSKNWKTICTRRAAFAAKGKHQARSRSRKRIPIASAPRWKIIENDSEFTEKNWSFDNDDGKCHLLHDLLNSEFITVERMGRILADFPEIPWQMKIDMAHQAWDEARHAEIVQRRLEELGGHVGMYKTSCFGWEQDVNRPDPLERLALSNMTFESESCKHLRDWIAKAKKAGDTRSVQLLEFLLADEVNHVLYGTHWVDELTKNDPERRKRVLAYPEKVLNEHHPVGVKFKETTYERA